MPESTPVSIIFTEGGLEAREWPAEVVNQNPDTGGLNLRVTTEKGEVLISDAPFHPTGAPGHWSPRAATKIPVSATPMTTEAPVDVIGSREKSEPEQPPAELALTPPPPIDEEPAIADPDIDPETSAAPEEETF